MKELIHIRNAEGDAVPPEEKENLLLAQLSALPSLIVALSVTALSPSYSAHDRAVVEEFVTKLGLRHEFIETHEMENPAYRANAADRCYFCKDELFSALDDLAKARR